MLVNWQDHKTIMVSFNARYCNAATENARCTSPTVPVAPCMRQEAGDFIVTAPDSEINADLRVDIMARRPVDFRSLCSPASIVRSDGSEVRFGFGNPGAHAIRIYSLGGALVLSRQGHGAVEKFDLRRLAKGSYRALVGEGCAARTLTICNW